jgi:hypothetical protein
MTPIERRKKFKTGFLFLERDIASTRAQGEYVPTKEFLDEVSRDLVMGIGVPKGILIPPMPGIVKETSALYLTAVERRLREGGVRTYPDLFNVLRKLHCAMAINANARARLLYHALVSEHEVKPKMER